MDRHFDEFNEKHATYTPRLGLVKTASRRRGVRTTRIAR